MDLNQAQLFAAVDRSAMMNNLEKNTRIMNYTGRVNLYSNANNPHQRYSQLDISSYLGCFGKENSQPSQLPEPFINCTPRKNDDAWRFNYAIDKQITRALVDVSGQFIPNNKLRIIPNNGLQLFAQKRHLPPSLSGSLGNIPASSLNRDFTNNNINKNMTYTANRQKLTGQDMTQAYINKDKPATPAVAAAAVAPVNNTRPRRPVGRPIGRAAVGSPRPLSPPAASASTAATPKKKKWGGGRR
jgi:hypothetical protein